MKSLFLAIALTATGTAYAAGVLACKTVDGVVKVPGKSKIESVLNRDPKIIGGEFNVRPRFAELKGSLLYQIDDQKVEVLRSTDDEFTVLIRAAGVPGNDDISIITVEKFEGAWTFKHYSSWLGLMTSGTCKEF